MNISVAATLGRAFKLVMGDKLFWLFGLLLSVSVITIVNGGFFRLPPFSTSTTLPSSGGTTFGGSFSTTGVYSPMSQFTTGVTCLGYILFLLYFLLLRPRLQAGLIISAVEADRDAPLTRQRAWEYGKYSMWSVFGLDLALSGIIAGIVIVMFCALYILLFASIAAVLVRAFSAIPPSGNPNTVPGGPFQDLQPFLSFIPAVVVAVLLLIPVIFAFTATVEYGKRAAALDHQLFGPAWRIGWQTLRANIGPTVRLYLLQLLISIPFGLLGGGFALLASWIYATLTPVGSDGSGTALALGLLLGIVLWVGTALLSAIPTAWNIVTWTLLYRKLVPPIAVPQPAQYYNPQWSQTQQLWQQYPAQPEYPQSPYSLPGQYPHGYPTSDQLGRTSHEPEETKEEKPENQ